MNGQTTRIKKWANFPKSFLSWWRYWMATDKVFNNVSSAGSKMVWAPSLIKIVNNLVVIIRTYSPYIPSVTWSQLLETNNPLALFYILKSLYPMPLPQLYHLQTSQTPKPTHIDFLQQHPFPFLGWQQTSQPFGCLRRRKMHAFWWFSAKLLLLSPSTHEWRELGFLMEWGELERTWEIIELS